MSLESQGSGAAVYDTISFDPVFGVFPSELRRYSIRMPHLLLLCSIFHGKRNQLYLAKARKSYVFRQS